MAKLIFLTKDPLFRIQIFFLRDSKEFKIYKKLKSRTRKKKISKDFQSHLLILEKNKWQRHSFHDWKVMSFLCLLVFFYNYSPYLLNSRWESLNFLNSRWEGLNSLAFFHEKNAREYQARVGFFVNAREWTKHSGNWSKISIRKVTFLCWLVGFTQQIIKI